MSDVEPEGRPYNVPGHFYVTVDAYEDMVEIAVRSKTWEAATHIPLEEDLDLQEEIGEAVGALVKNIIRLVNIPEPDGTIN